MADKLPPLIVDLGSAVPVYRQIVDALRPLLVSGHLQPGEALPPVRQIALGLGVHFNTVAEAYRILSEEGWLDLKRGRGAVVLERTLPASADPATKATFGRRVRELVAEVQAKGLSSKFLAKELRLLAEALEK